MSHLLSSADWWSLSSKLQRNHFNIESMLMYMHYSDSTWAMISCAQRMKFCQAQINWGIRYDIKFQNYHSRPSEWTKDQSPNAINHHARCTSPSNRLFIVVLLHSKDSQRHENNIQSFWEPWDLKTYKSWYPLILLAAFFKLNLSQPSHILWPTAYSPLTQAPWLLLSLPWFSLCQDSVGEVPPYQNTKPWIWLQLYRKGKNSKAAKLYIYQKNTHIYWQTWVKLLLCPTVILKGYILSCTEFKKLAIWYNKDIKIWNTFIQNC